MPCISNLDLLEILPQNELMWDVQLITLTIVELDTKSN